MSNPRLEKLTRSANKVEARSRKNGAGPVVAPPDGAPDIAALTAQLRGRGIPVHRGASVEQLTQTAEAGETPDNAHVYRAPGSSSRGAVGHKGQEESGTLATESESLPSPATVSVRSPRSQATGSVEPQNRRNSGQFLPGQSGNPSGRPKGLMRFIREQTRDGQEIAEFFLAIFRGDSTPLGKKPTRQERQEAADWLAQRGFGKPTQWQGQDAESEPVKLQWIDPALWNKSEES